VSTHEKLFSPYAVVPFSYWPPKLPAFSQLRFHYCAWSGVGTSPFFSSRKSEITLVCVPETSFSINISALKKEAKCSYETSAIHLTSRG